MKAYFLIALFICVSAACVEIEKPAKQELTVSAAVSLKDAFTEIGHLFSEKTGVAVSFNFAGSGTLQQQIESGAPADIFASAGEPQMDALAEKGLIVTETRKNFASNELVLIVPTGSKLDITDLEGLKNDKIKKIAVGNPKTVPAGQYTQQTFDSLKLSESLKPKLVFAENVRQVLEYAARGEADAGIVYSTDAAIARDKVMVTAAAPKDSHHPIVYPTAVIKDSNNPAASAFIDLVTSKKGQEILQKYGFLTPVK